MLIYLTAIGVGVPNQGAGDISVSNPFDDVVPGQSQRPNSYGPPFGHTGGPPRPPGTSLPVCLLSPSCTFVSFNCSHVHFLVCYCFIFLYASMQLTRNACSLHTKNFDEIECLIRSWYWGKWCLYTANFWHLWIINYIYNDKCDSYNINIVLVFTFLTLIYIKNMLRGKRLDSCIQFIIIFNPFSLNYAFI